MADNDIRLDRQHETVRQNLVKLIQNSVEEVTEFGFSVDIARFDCLHTLKVIIYGLYDECDIGHARRAWYQEHVRA